MILSLHNPPPAQSNLSPHSAFQLRSSDLVQRRIEVTRAVTVLVLDGRGQHIFLDLAGDAIIELDVAAIAGAADRGARSAAAERCKKKWRQLVCSQELNPRSW